MPNMGRYRISSSHTVTGSIMVVSQKVFFQREEAARPRPFAALPGPFFRSAVMLILLFRTLSHV